MLLQNILTQRIIIVLIFQVWPIFYLSYLAYKLLKRARNRSTYTLSSVFIMISLAYSLSSISILFNYTPYAYFLYLIAIYFFMFGNSLFVIFSWMLVKLERKSPHWMFQLGITFYGIISTYIIFVGFFLEGIRYDSSTEWIPAYSWFFLILSWFLLLIFLVIPQIYLSNKLIKVFEGVVLKKRITLFIISVFLEFASVYGLFLYNTWIENEIYRNIYVFIFPPIATIAAYLIYRSFGKELE
ncbi:MAG: hypothetical protein HWN80_05380 [Candidatus Lokiarchaeota archaeon]|nr:hypothetical protein [Candidatus Lokiarchaeota archaeon]